MMKEVVEVPECENSGRDLRRLMGLAGRGVRSWNGTAVQPGYQHADSCHVVW